MEHRLIFERLPQNRFFCFTAREPTHRDQSVLSVRRQNISSTTLTTFPTYHYLDAEMVGLTSQVTQIVIESQPEYNLPPDSSNFLRVVRPALPKVRVKACSHTGYQRCGLGKIRIKLNEFIPTIFRVKFLEQVLNEYLRSSLAKLILSAVRQLIFQHL